MHRSSVHDGFIGLGLNAMKVEVSIGELADKVSILAIKLEKIADPSKRSNILKEYDLLSKVMKEIGIKNDNKEYEALCHVNRKLWAIEDHIRLKEARKEFDDEFIQLARAVYFTNDERAAIKRRINLAFGSELLEEKEYVDYRGATDSSIQ